jgi:hypothetical protein
MAEIFYYVVLKIRCKDAAMTYNRLISELVITPEVRSISKKYGTKYKKCATI